MWPHLALVLLAVSSCASAVPGSNTLDVGVGTVVAPAGFVATHAVATDVMVGTLSDGHLDVTFSIGSLAGTQMHSGRRSECSWFDTQTTSALTQRTACLLADGGGRHLVVTVVPVPIPGAFFPSAGYPANFSADLVDEGDRAEVLAIASSYLPSAAVGDLVVWVPRGIERRADAAAPGSGSHPALTMEADPVAVRPTVGRVLGSRVTWHQRDAAGAFEPVLVVDRCGVDLRSVLGPPGVPEHDLRVDVVVFETLVPCGAPWDAFSDPRGDGYRALHRASVPPAGGGE